MVFAFLFGLSMDYEVFILSRIREEYDAGASTDEAVIEGIGRTGRLVTSAALILGCQAPHGGVPRGELSGSPRLGPIIFAGAALAPIVLAALAQAYVSYELPELKWVNLAWRARGVPLYLSFAFWEWVTCAVFSVYMVVLARNTLAECRSS